MYLLRLFLISLFIIIFVPYLFLSAFSHSWCSWRVGVQFSNYQLLLPVFCCSVLVRLPSPPQRSVEILSTFFIYHKNTKLTQKPPTPRGRIYPMRRGAFPARQERDRWMVGDGFGTESRFSCFPWLVRTPPYGDAWRTVFWVSSVIHTENNMTSAGWWSSDGLAPGSLTNGGRRSGWGVRKHSLFAL